MCWLSTEKRTYKVADEDIRTYKVMVQMPGVKIFDSLYNHKSYEVGQIYKTTVNPVYNIENKYKTRIENGFHSYDKSKTEIKDDSNSWYINAKNREDYSLDIIWYPPSLREYKDIVAVECVIPKGSCYYENEDGEIVSNQIMVTDNILKKSNFNDKILKKELLKI